MSGQQEHYDILVVGKSGNGKSAVCNTLLGQEKFDLGRSMATTTTTVQYSDRHLGNKTVRVIDTPDITNCGLKSDRDRQAEVNRWKNVLTSPNPSMVLVTIRCDVRFTAEEFAVYREILRLWRTSHSLNSTLVVAFTFGDRQDYDIAEDVANPPPELGQILQLAKKRHMVFTNKDSADREGQAKRCFSMLQDLQESESLCPNCFIL
ncbi:hypothetical protein ACOMHN_054556 [Nucella lapillus]